MAWIHVLGLRFFYDESVWMFLTIGLLIFILYINYSEYRYSLILFTILALIFTTYNSILLFILFEVTLMPLALIIGYYGSDNRNIGSLYLYVYTFIGSIVWLVGLISGCLVYDLSTADSGIICMLIVIGILFKVPSVPFHMWLPKAHVEAPTYGSIILAGIMLKVAPYSIIIMVKSYAYMNVFLLTIAVLSLLTSLLLILQVDIKRFIAYLSIGHMALIVSINNLYLAEFDISVLCLAHALSSSILFYTVGSIYSRYHSRIIRVYSGLWTSLPVLASILFIGVLISNCLPLSMQFIWEYLALVRLSSVSYTSTLLLIVLTSPLILASLYVLCVMVTGDSINARQIDATRYEVVAASVPIVLSMIGLIYFIPTTSIIPSSMASLTLQTCAQWLWTYLSDTASYLYPISSLYDLCNYITTELGSMINVYYTISGLLYALCHVTVSTGYSLADALLYYMCQSYTAIYTILDTGQLSIGSRLYAYTQLANLYHHTSEAYISYYTNHAYSVNISTALLDYISTTTMTHLDLAFQLITALRHTWTGPITS